MISAIKLWGLAQKMLKYGIPVAVFQFLPD